MKVMQDLAGEFLGQGAAQAKEADIINAIGKAFEVNPEKAINGLMRLFGEELDAGLDGLRREKDQQNKKAAARKDRKQKRGAVSQEKERQDAGLREKAEHEAARRVKQGLEHVMNIAGDFLETDEKELDFSGMISKDQDKKAKAFSNAARVLGNVAFKAFRKRVEEKEESEETLDDEIYGEIHSATTSLSRHIAQEMKLLKQSPTVKGKVVSAAAGLYLGGLILAETVSKPMAKVIDQLAPPMLSAIGGLVGGALATAAVEAAAGGVGATVAGISVAPLIAVAGVAAAPIGAMVGKTVGQFAGKALGALAKFTSKGLTAFSKHQQVWINKKRAAKGSYILADEDPKKSKFDTTPDESVTQRLSKQRDFFEGNDWELQPAATRKADYMIFNKNYEKKEVKVTAKPRQMSIESKDDQLPQNAMQDFCQGVEECFTHKRVKVEATSLEDLENFAKAAQEQGLEITAAKYYDHDNQPVILDEEEIQALVQRVEHRVKVTLAND